jgi:hypothetical protein
VVSIDTSLSGLQYEAVRRASLGDTGSTLRSHLEIGVNGDSSRAASWNAILLGVS